LLHVDTSELHGLCKTGGQDWFKFGAVGGKYYTIEIMQTDPGLDLALDARSILWRHEGRENPRVPVTYYLGRAKRAGF